jgi:universal stress protein A
MTLYKHILIAVDLHPNCDKTVIQRGMEIAKANNATISIIHSVEHINAYGVAEAYSAVLDVEAQLMAEARKELSKLGMELGIPSSHQYLEVGTPRSVILEKVEELNADLIVVGSHGRHGFQLLLGSTANAVLHHANCDVLAVRVREES